MNPYDIINKELDDDLKAAGDIAFPLLLQIQQLRATRQLSKDIQYLIKEVGSFRIEQQPTEVSGNMSISASDITSLNDALKDAVMKIPKQKKIPNFKVGDGSIKKVKGKLPKVVSDMTTKHCTCSPGYHSEKCPVHGKLTG